MNLLKLGLKKTKTSLVHSSIYSMQFYPAYFLHLVLGIQSQDRNTDVEETIVLLKHRKVNT